MPPGAAVSFRRVRLAREALERIRMGLRFQPPMVYTIRRREGLRLGRLRAVHAELTKKILNFGKFKRGSRLVARFVNVNECL